MKKHTEVNEKEEKDKKRGFYITTIVHAGLLALAFYPIMGALQDIALEENAVQYIELTEATKPDVEFVANAKTSRRKNDSNEKPQSKEVKPTPEPPKPEPKTTPDPKPVETIEDDEATEVTTSENKNATEVKKAEVQDNKKPTPKPTPSPAPNPSGTKSDKNKAGGNSTKNTHSGGDGGNDSDLKEGVFGRRVKYRPNIKGLTKKKGRIAIKVCVSQEGTVIASKYVQSLSTITDPKIVANAVRAARRYKFDVDYSAPRKQWGKLTFIFDLK